MVGSSLFLSSWDAIGGIAGLDLIAQRFLLGFFTGYPFLLFVTHPLLRAIIVVLTLMTYSSPSNLTSIPPAINFLAFNIGSPLFISMYVLPVWDNFKRDLLQRCEKLLSKIGRKLPIAVNERYPHYPSLDIIKSCLEVFVFQAAFYLAIRTIQPVLPNAASTLLIVAPWVLSMRLSLILSHCILRILLWINHGNSYNHYYDRIYTNHAGKIIFLASLIFALSLPPIFQPITSVLVNLSYSSLLVISLLQLAFIPAVVLLVAQITPSIGTRPSDLIRAFRALVFLDLNRVYFHLQRYWSTPPPSPSSGNDRESLLGKFGGAHTNSNKFPGQGKRLDGTPVSIPKDSGVPDKLSTTPPSSSIFRRLLSGISFFAVAEGTPSAMPPTSSSNVKR